LTWIDPTNTNVGDYPPARSLPRVGTGATEAFDRDKAIAGVRKSGNGRPVSDLARLGRRRLPALLEHP